ncbi:hypothetical protein ACFYVL_15855 [Streptomyces sp. NPDC004111]|uniref:hypothetical protein n=1 Tax=Streptomyces sp. NPDC004111 TaxID=3364690 RepID=UPI0036A0AB04
MASRPEREPKVAFEQPLFHREFIAADWKRMRSQITSTTALEAAYRVVQPQVAELGIDLSEEDSEQLRLLYNATVADGRFIGRFMKDPKGVAKKLKMEVSDEAVEAVKRASTIGALRPQEEDVGGAGAAIVVVAVVIVIVFGPKRPSRGTPQVLDSSGIAKL